MLTFAANEVKILVIHLTPFWLNLFNQIVETHLLSQSVKDLQSNLGSVQKIFHKKNSLVVLMFFCKLFSLTFLMFLMVCNAVVGSGNSWLDDDEDFYFGQEMEQMHNSVDYTAPVYLSYSDWFKSWIRWILQI